MYHYFHLINLRCFESECFLSWCQLDEGSWCKHKSFYTGNIQLLGSSGHDSRASIPAKLEVEVQTPSGNNFFLFVGLEKSQTWLVGTMLAIQMILVNVRASPSVSSYLSKL